MAKVTPYGDSRAHGSMGKAITFRRFRGRTRLQKHPTISPTHTVGQLAQRQKFSLAIKDLNSLNNQWKLFLYSRGVSTSRHGPNLYVSAHMKNRLPSVTPGIPMDALESIVLFNPAGIDSDSIKISIFSPLPELDTVLWNKHQDAALVSEIGGDGQALGTITFAAGKFDNAARIDANGECAKYVNFAPTMDWHSMIYEYWMLTDYNVVNGNPADATVHRTMTSFFKIGGNQKGCGWWIHTGINKFYYLDDEMIMSNVTVDWNATTWNHYVLILDRTASFDADKTAAFYFNGDQISSCNSALSDWSNPTDHSLYIGCSHLLSEPIDGMIDNPKIHSPASADKLAVVLAGRDQEGNPGDQELGHIYDSENVFTQGDPILPTAAYKIKIENTSGNPEQIPFDYLLVPHWLRDPDDTGTSRIRLPKLILPGSTYFDLYIATDGSVYWDEAMTQLACTPKMYYSTTE